MKNYLLYMSIFIAGLTLQTNAQSPQWHYVGDTIVSNDYSNGSILALHEGVPYIAYPGNCGNYPFPTIRRFNGVNWESLDTAGLGDWQYQHLAILADGTPQLAYFENKKFGLKRLVNNTWNIIAESPQLGTSIHDFSYAFEDDKLFVAFADSYLNDHISVWEFDGNTWIQLGQSGISTAYAYPIILKVSNGVPWLAYMEPTSSKACIVKKFDGSDWQTVGGQAFIGTFTYMPSPNFVYHAPHIDFAVSNGSPFVAYSDSATQYRMNVLTFYGTGWILVGQPNFTASVTSDFKIALDAINQKPYVLFNDHTTDMAGATAMNFNGTTWDYVGNRFFAPDFWRPNFEIHKGVPYFASEPPLFCPHVSVQAFSPLTKSKEPPVIEFSFDIQPNPIASGVVAIQTHSETALDLMAQIATMDGRIIQKSVLTIGPGRAEHIFSVSGLPTGVYILQLQSKEHGGISSKKFVIPN